MISFTDDEMTLVTDACRPLEVKDRGLFLRGLAAEIAKIGLGACARSPVVT